MEEAMEMMASGWPAIALLSVWWAFLTTLETLFPPAERIGADAQASDLQQASDGVLDEERVALRAAHPDFDPDSFLEGARNVYGTVLEAYAAGDLDTLRPLVSADVLAVFAEACAGREARGETRETILIGIHEAGITHIALLHQTIEITVTIRADFVGVTRSGTGAVIDGDPVAIGRSADVWTFARPISSQRRGWILVATG